MSYRRWIAVGVGIIALVPSAAMANGMVHMVHGFEFTFSGAVAGCLAGVIVALARHAKVGNLLAFSVGCGTAVGLVTALLFIGAHVAFFFPNNAGIAGGLVVLALGTGLLGGLAVGLVGAGVRALRRGGNRGNDRSA